jgi:hypothetical protein
MIQLVNADGAWNKACTRSKAPAAHAHRTTALGTPRDMLLRTHARIREMQTSAQLTLRHARDLLLPLREEARRHNAVTRGAALALSAIRRKGIDAVPQAAMPMFTRPQSTFLGVEESRPMFAPPVCSSRTGAFPRHTRPTRAMPACATHGPELDRCETLCRCQPDDCLSKNRTAPPTNCCGWFSRHVERLQTRTSGTPRFHTRAPVTCASSPSRPAMPPRILSTIAILIYRTVSAGADFRELFKGYHVSRRDPELYAQLSNFQDQYRTLFKALGFELVCDTRGFYHCAGPRRRR